LDAKVDTLRAEMARRFDDLDAELPTHAKVHGKIEQDITVLKAVRRGRLRGRRVGREHAEGLSLTPSRRQPDAARCSSRSHASAMGGPAQAAARRSRAGAGSSTQALAAREVLAYAAHSGIQIYVSLGGIGHIAIEEVPAASGDRIEVEGSWVGRDLAGG